jgi:hypothetical protein
MYIKILKKEAEAAAEAAKAVGLPVTNDTSAPSSASIKS